MQTNATERHGEWINKAWNDVISLFCRNWVSRVLRLSPRTKIANILYFDSKYHNSCRKQTEWISAVIILSFWLYEKHLK